MWLMLKGTRLTLMLVRMSNCAYIVRLSNCPPHLMQVFRAGGRRRGGFDTCGKTEKAQQILTKTERLDPRLPAISARVVLDSCKNLKGERGTQRRARVSATSHETGYLNTIRRFVWMLTVRAGEAENGGPPPSKHSFSVNCSFLFHFYPRFFTSASLLVYFGAVLRHFRHVSLERRNFGGLFDRRSGRFRHNDRKAGGKNNPPIGRIR